MRILHVVQKPQRRGAEIAAHRLSAGQRKLGHDVRIVYLYDYEGDHPLHLASEDRMLRGSERHPMERVPGLHPGLLRSLRSCINELVPDVVQVNGGRAVKYGCAVARLSPDRKWVLVYRNIGEPQKWVTGILRGYFYRRLIMPKIDGVIGVSRSTLEGVGKHYDLSVPMTYIRTGIDPGSLVPRRRREEVRDEMGARPGDPVLLYVGSLTPEKRVDRLLRLAARLQPRWPDLHIWIVGEGPERSSLEAEAEISGVADRVNFIGLQEQVADFYVAADLLVLTSDTEGIPGVVLEGGYLGLPAVATRVGGVEECLLDGETGLLVDPDSEEHLEASVARLLAAPAERQAMGTRAKSWMQERFLIERVVGTYIEFYEHVLRQRQGADPARAASGDPRDTAQRAGFGSAPPS